MKTFLQNLPFVLALEVAFLLRPATSTDYRLEKCETVELGCYDPGLTSQQWPLFAYRTQETPRDQQYMTPQLCAAKCFNDGFTAPTDMSSIEWGFECYCGSGYSSTVPPVARKMPDEDCQLKVCPGDKSQFCGGADRCVLRPKKCSFVSF